MSKRLMKITQSRLHEVMNYYPETGQLFWKSGSEAGTLHKGYRYIKVDGVRYAAHRLVWLYAWGVWPEALQVDHIDGDGLNNRLSNLRLVTNRQNQQNRGADKGRKYKGVYRSRDRFKAEITTSAGRLFLGVFGTAEDAARAYNEAAKAHHGEYARLNEVEYGKLERIN